MSEAPKLRLGEFEFEPQPAKVLTLLANRAGEVVSHEELRAHVWGEETYVDFDRGLRYCIGQIRSALGDSAQRPRFIETLPKRGYRLLVPVHREGLDDLGPAPSAVPSGRASAAGKRVLVVLAVAVTLCVVTVLVLGWPGADQPSSTPAAITVAVVPFDNETGDVAKLALARSFSDAVVVRLAAAEPGRLEVIGNAAPLFGPRESRDLEQLGRELAAPYIVLGQLQGQDGRIRVFAHLIRASDQKHLWAVRLQAGELDALAFEAQVAERVTEGVRRRLLESPLNP